LMNSLLALEILDLPSADFTKKSPIFIRNVVLIMTRRTLTPLCLKKHSSSLWDVVAPPLRAYAPTFFKKTRKAYGF